jgi:hypothetical protein
MKGTNPLDEEDRVSGVVGIITGITEFYDGWIKLKIRTRTQKFRLITPLAIVHLGPIDRFRLKLTYPKLENPFEPYEASREVQRMIERTRNK